MIVLYYMAWTFGTQNYTAGKATFLWTSLAYFRWVYCDWYSHKNTFIETRSKFAVVHDLSTLDIEGFQSNAEYLPSGSRASYKIIKILISPNSHTRYLKYFYFRIYRNMQRATLISIYNSNYQWKLSSLKADESVIKSYHHCIIRKTKLFYIAKYIWELEALGMYDRR